MISQFNKLADRKRGWSLWRQVGEIPQSLENAFKERNSEKKEVWGEVFQRLNM